MNSHCRKCGMIYCSKCSNQKAKLDTSANFSSDGVYMRICISCFEEFESQLSIDSPVESMNAASKETIQPENEKEIKNSLSNASNSTNINWQWSTF